jgi:poly(A) polymerase
MFLFFRKNMDQSITLSKDWLLEYPQIVRDALGELVGGGSEVYVTGGAVRDWLCSVLSGDLDITVANDGIEAARYFADKTGGAFVMLDEKERVARVVVNDLSVDISSFREGTDDILTDLCRRDFSINAMAVAIDRTGSLAKPYKLLDPLGGVADLEKESIRAPAIEVFDNDPLRLLRAYRFSALLDFNLTMQTEEWIREKSHLIVHSAPERICHELDRIVASPLAAATSRKIYEAGLLGEIFPEIILGEGLDQPSSHHLDVFEHNMAALEAIEEIIADPAEFFPEHTEHFLEYLSLPDRPLRLKWAALFHDLGKPETHKIKDDGRATFYNHDRTGAEMFNAIGKRLRCSRERLQAVSGLIGLHMYPFHLCNAEKKTGLTPRACLRLVKSAGEDLRGLFLLAMADSLASRGPLRPPDMEKDLAALYVKVYRVYSESIKPVLAAPLLSGDDLIEIGLQPGPLFGRILDELEQAQVAGEVTDRQQALSFASNFLNDENG